MPPSIILEVLKITEAEMELRDATREAEQAREARTAEQVAAAAGPLAEEQEDLVLRTDDVIQDIRELPEGEFEFEREIQTLRGARAAMDEAFVLLDDELTGASRRSPRRPRRSSSSCARVAPAAQVAAAAARPLARAGKAAPRPPARSPSRAAPSAPRRRSRRDVDRSTSRTASRIPAEFVEVLGRYFDALEGR